MAKNGVFTAAKDCWPAQWHCCCDIKKIKRSNKPCQAQLLFSVVQFHLRGEKRGRETFQLHKRLLVFKIYGNCSCDTVRLTLSGWITKGKIVTHYFRHSMLQTGCGGKPHIQILNVSPVVEKDLLLDGGKESAWKARPGREDHPCILLSHYTCLPSLLHSLSCYTALPSRCQHQISPKTHKDTPTTCRLTSAQKATWKFRYISSLPSHLFFFANLQ